ncbi:glycosyltransferase [Aeromonas caviae]|uniref:glycosyltransferase n=1 Tax=Aeromonas caviae TaxID=648 RepID=UPI00191E61AD|nr:glycosyltransferase [Aeromonas caviae]MBL0554399.1 glycosyltransferase [Aeromonas caviae]
MDKVMIFLPSLGGGGAEKNAAVLANFLSERYFVEIVCCYKEEKTKSSAELNEKVRLRFLGKERAISALCDIYKIIKVERPKAVITTVAYFSLLFSVLIPFLPRTIKYLCRETNIPEVYGAQKGVIYKWVSNLIYRFFYKNYNAVICQSDDMLSSIKFATKLSDSSLVKINNPALISSNRCDELLTFPDDISAREGEYLIAAGRLTYQKGFDLLLEEYNTSTLKNYGIKLLIAGVGPDENILKSRVRELGLEECIYFLGYRKDIEVLISHARGFVLSSRFEGFPNVVLEALILGCPVLARDCPGGIRELIHDGVNGVLYEHDFADAITRFMEIKFDKLSISNDVSNRFNLAKLFSKYYELIEQ